MAASDCEQDLKQSYVDVRFMQRGGVHRIVHATARKCAGIRLCKE